MAVKEYDVIVAGSGPAGSTVAWKCASEGLKTAVADHLFGGTCALRGCTPKKAMESVTSLYWETKDLAGHGTTVPSPVNWKELMTHKQQFTSLVTANTRESFRDGGIELIESTVRFDGPRSLTDGSHVYKASHIVVATGARPRPLDFPGSEYLCLSSDFLQFPQLPKRLVFAGGGYVGFELAHIAAACGSEITIVSRADKPLRAFDPDLVTQFVKSTLDKGIDLRLGYSVKAVVKKGKQYLVTIGMNGNDKFLELEADAVIHSAGRVPNTHRLDLEKAGIEDSKGIKVNDFLQTKGNESVYAVGDVNDRFPFTPVGKYEGSIAAHNILNKKKKKKKADHRHIPYVLFTYPKLASVGRHEADLKKEETDYEVFQLDTGDWLIEKAAHNSHAGYKILVSKKDQSVLGAHLLGIKSDEMINLFAFAMQKGLKAPDLKDVKFAFPTVANWLPSMVGG